MGSNETNFIKQMAQEPEAEGAFAAGAGSLPLLGLFPAAVWAAFHSNM